MCCACIVATAKARATEPSVTRGIQLLVRTMITDNLYYLLTNAHGQLNVIVVTSYIHVDNKMYTVYPKIFED